MKFKKFNEFNTSMTDKELLEMANVTDETSGIKNVVIWIGPSPMAHGHRIKISNTPNTFEGSNCFVMTIPDYEIIGKINGKFITSDKIEKIKEFVKKNIEIILKYSNYQMSTKDLLDNLKSV